MNRGIRRSAIAAALIVLASDAGSAEIATRFFSGNDWAAFCSAGNYSGLSFYVTGIADATAAEQSMGDKNPPFCLPISVSGAQLAEIFCGHLKINPERRHYDAGFLAIEAFSIAFPCR